MSNLKAAATVNVGLLDFAPGATLERDEDAPLLFSVWLDGDIIGAGDTQDEAVAEAARQIVEWSRRAPRGGYTPCACEFCFEIAIGEPGSALCSGCEMAGCSDGECCCLDADDLA